MQEFTLYKIFSFSSFQCAVLSLFTLMIFLLEYFLQNRRLELFKAAVPSVSSASYFKINHSPGGNEQYRKMQAVRILPGREICSAVLWLLCKVLFNDTATEGVLYYLSHCSSLQSQHCISTLLFYIYKQQAIPEKFLFQLHNSTDRNCVITSPCWGKSCCCSCRGSLPAALGGSSCPPRSLHSPQGEGGAPPSRSKLGIMGAAAGLQPLFSICGNPRGKRSHGDTAGPWLSVGSGGTWTH